MVSRRQATVKTNIPCEASGSLLFSVAALNEYVADVGDEVLGDLLSPPQGACTPFSWGSPLLGPPLP